MFCNQILELCEFTDKVKQNINTAIFNMNMAEKPLSEVADFLEILVSEVKVPESVQQRFTRRSVQYGTKPTA
ncbi:MAG: hypothetical protein ACRD8Z_05990 [Nitrososphaeraceae archaeon]